MECENAEKQSLHSHWDIEIFSSVCTEHYDVVCSATCHIMSRGPPNFNAMIRLRTEALILEKQLPVSPLLSPVIISFARVTFAQLALTTLNRARARAYFSKTHQRIIRRVFAN